MHNIPLILTIGYMVMATITLYLTKRLYDGESFREVTVRDIFLCLVFWWLVPLVMLCYYLQDNSINFMGYKPFKRNKDEEPKR